MDAITTYIEQMFRTLPQNAEVRRARAELLDMCEDRYQEMRAEGVSEHEAVGRVITQFGNLEELADGLGIRAFLGKETVSAVQLSAAEAERFVRTSRRSSVLIGLGVIVVLIGLTSREFLASARKVNNPVVGEAAELAVFFTAVAIAVALFVIGGMMMGRFARLEDRVVELDGVTLLHYQQQREREETTHMALVVAGIVTIILGAAATAVGYSDETGRSEILNLLRVIGAPVIGVGVFLLIRAGMRRTALDRLTQDEDAAADAETLADRWAGPYFILATIVFLAWSFISGDWGTTWLVWPIAGLGFAFLSAVLSAAKRRDDARR